MITGLNKIQTINIISPMKRNIGFRGVAQTPDSFQSTMTPETVARKKFDSLFPNNKIDKIYNQINSDFGITTPAKLNFVYDETSQLGGGFTFNKNTIEMNLYDLITCDKKIVGIKDGKKYPLVSPKEKLPLFINKTLANEFVNTHNQKGSLGFEKLIVEDVTPEEHKKFILQKIVHECIHAKQHQMLRESEGIDDKTIIKAWTHVNPKNKAEEDSLNAYVEKRYETTPWANIEKPEIKYKKGSAGYQKAMIYLNAIQNYPPVTSPLYTINPLEREAFDISAIYVNTHKF